MESNNSGKTAMSRSDFSGPMKWITSHGCVTNETRGLDYGCGKGDDADRLGFDGHDINHRPNYQLVEEAKAGNGYDVVTCIYVLNTLPDARERLNVERDLVKCLAPGGVAYIAVRNDKKYLKGWTSKGTWQGYVEPHCDKWELVEKNGHFRLYRYVRTECVEVTT